MSKRQIICMPVNLFKNEQLICGCNTPIINGETAYIVKTIDPDNKYLVFGDSGLVKCGTCLTKDFPEFKTIK